MAKTKENTRPYLGAYLPTETRKYKTTRVNWGGLNLLNTYNTGQLSYADGVCVSLLPYIETDRALGVLYDGDGKYAQEGYKILGVYQGEDNLIIIYSVNTLSVSGTSYTGEYSVYADVIHKEFTYYAGNTMNSKINPATGTYYMPGEVYSTVNNAVFTAIIQKYPHHPTGTSDHETNKSYKSSYYKGSIHDFDTAAEAFEDLKDNTPDIELPRCAVLFNTYTNPLDPAGTDIDKRLLIFPDKCSLPTKYNGIAYRVASSNASTVVSNNIKKPDRGATYHAILNSTDSGRFIAYNGSEWNYISGSASGIMLAAYFGYAYPDIKYAAVHNSRLYGVDDMRVYVSGFNDYTDMNIDTVVYSTEAGAWLATTQASTEMSGTFRAVVGFGEEVVAFKDDYMYIISGSSNPFRLREICSVGCIDHRSVCEIDGRLYFTAKDGIYLYRDGYLPSCISDPIRPETDNISEAVAYSENGRYHVNIGGAEYIYDTANATWTKNDYKTAYIAAMKNGPLPIMADQSVIYTPAESYRESWKLRTDFYNSHTSDVKHPTKIQLMFECDPQAELFISLCAPDIDDTLIYHYVNADGERVVKHARISLRYRDLESYAVTICGSGYIKLHAMEIVTQAGGDLFV